MFAKSQFRDDKSIKLKFETVNRERFIYRKIGETLLRGPNRSKLTEHPKLISLLIMNLEGFSYNLQQRESKSAY